VAALVALLKADGRWVEPSAAGTPLQGGVRVGASSS
jgi:hypothetical protein